MKVLSKQCQQVNKMSNNKSKLLVGFNTSFVEVANLWQLNIPITARHWTKPSSDKSKNP